MAKGKGRSKSKVGKTSNKKSIRVLCPGGSKRVLRTSRPGYPKGKKSLVPVHYVDEAVNAYKKMGINTVILLLTDGESWKYYDADLARLYTERGMRVFRFPIIDFGVPTTKMMLRCVQKIRSCLRGSENSKSWKCNNIVVHCSAGQGRTGLVGECLSMFMGKDWCEDTYLGESLKQGDFIREFWKYLNKTGSFTPQAERDIAAGWNYLRGLRRPSSSRRIFQQDWRQDQMFDDDLETGIGTDFSGNYDLTRRYPSLTKDPETDPFKKRLRTSNEPSSTTGAFSRFDEEEDEEISIFDDEYEDEDGVE